jgi:hypothetical protein
MPSTEYERPAGNVCTVISMYGTLAKKMSLSSTEAGVDHVHDSPAFVVLICTPFTPTAHPSTASTKNTELSSPGTGCCSVQSVPPFVVLRTAPEPPTAKPRFASTNRTEFKPTVVGVDAVLDSPPLTVLMTTPDEPTPTGRGVDEVHASQEWRSGRVESNDAAVIVRSVIPAPTAISVLVDKRAVSDRGGDAVQLAPAL